MPSSPRPRGGNRISPRASSVRRRSDIATVRTCQTWGSLLEDQIADAADSSTNRSLGAAFAAMHGPDLRYLRPRSLALGQAHEASRAHNAARRRDSSIDRPAAADNSFLIKSLHLAVAWVSFVPSREALMAPDIATRVAIICVVSVFLCLGAVAQEGYYGVGHDRWHMKF